MTKHLRLFLPLFALACGGSDKSPAGDSGATETTTPPAGSDFTLLGDADSLPAAALLSIWGSSSSDVWIVGADDGTGPVVLHSDGTAWSRVDTGTTGDLWWVWGDGEGMVFFSGANGRVVTHDTAAGTFEETEVADPRITLFGLWGTSATDLWTVGGDVNGVLDGVMIHHDGTDWTEMGTAPPNDGSTRASFKVWGRSSDDVWVVGTQALITHWDGTAFTQVLPEPVYISTPLTTIHGDGDQVVVVGGFGAAAVVRDDGTGWADDSPPPADVAPAFNGVYVRGGSVMAAGVRGAIWSRDDAGWTSTGDAITTDDYHGTWIDPEGHFWAVGGNLTTLSSGVVATDRTDTAPISL
jgi:hypothetical protein